MLWWSSIGEPLVWTAGLVVFFVVMRWLLLDYVLDTLGPSPGQWPPRLDDRGVDADSSRAGGMSAIDVG